MEENTVNTANKIKVLICDDSATFRKILTMELSRDENIEIIGAVTDPYMARDKIIENKPDVLLLDIEMPRMDGVTFLGKLMKSYPIRVIVVSSFAESGSSIATKAIEYGALEVLYKPDSMYSAGDMFEQLIEKIKTVMEVSEDSLQALSERVASIQKKPLFTSVTQTANKVIAIGASTGGTEALRQVLERMPVNTPPIVIVQHMPQYFTKIFAEHLDSVCQIKVKEADDMEILSHGKALIAPGDRHMEVVRSGSVYHAKVFDDPPVFHQRPSVEKLFLSVAKYVGRNAVGVILTGMGKDGASAMVEMKKEGAYTIAQDEKSSVVFGMPREAIELGGVIKIVPLSQMSETIIEATESSLNE